MKNQINLIQVSMDAANVLLTTQGDSHYLGPVKYPPYYSLSTPQADAVATYSAPIASSFKRKGGLPEGERLCEVLELTRLWVSRQSDLHTTQFLAATLRWIRAYGFIKEGGTDKLHKPKAVLSYADPRDGVGHTGKIYTETGWIYLGASSVTQEFEALVDCSFERQDFQRVDGKKVYFPTGKYVSFKAGDRITLPFIYRVFKTKSTIRIMELSGGLWKPLDAKQKHVFLYPFVKSEKAIASLVAGSSRYRGAVIQRHTGPPRD